MRTAIAVGGRAIYLEQELRIVPRASHFAAKALQSFFSVLNEGETRFLQESNALADDGRHLKRVFSMRLV